MSVEERAQYEKSMVELRQYCLNASEKFGPLRNYPQKTQFNPNIHFKPAAIHSLIVETSLVAEYTGESNIFQ